MAQTSAPSEEVCTTTLLECVGSVADQTSFWVSRLSRHQPFFLNDLPVIERITWTSAPRSIHLNSARPSGAAFRPDPEQSQRAACDGGQLLNFFRCCRAVGS